jgi:hypothetical protein
MCEMAEGGNPLPLRKLEPLPRSRPAGLLPLDSTGIAGHQAGRPELDPVLSVGLYQGPCNGVPKRAGLSGLPAPIHVCLHIERAESIGGGERLLNVLHQ